jgi:hypothetical protein
MRIPTIPITRLTLAGLAVACSLGAFAPSAGAAAGPGWQVTGRSLPTHLQPGNTGIVELELYNVGAADSSGQITVTDVLPPGVTASSPLYYLAFNEEIELVPFYWNCSGVGTSVLTCTNPPGLPSIPTGVQQQLLLHVDVGAVAPAAETNHVTVAGGGALAPASTTDPMVLSPTPPGFGFSGFDGWFTNTDGTLDTQAGSHPYELTVSFDLNSKKSSEAPAWVPFPTGGQVRKVDVNLPPGIIGNPTAVPRCTRQQFDGNEFTGECPAATQIGVDTAGISADEERISQLVLPVYNLVPPPGVPAEFGFYILGHEVLLDAGVRSGDDYGITEHVDNIAQVKVIFNSTTVWGVPGEASHDAQRRGTGAGCTTQVPPLGHGCSDPAPLKPFLTLPTSCVGPQSFTAQASPWEFPDVMAEASFLTHDGNDVQAGFTGCDHLEFAPSISTAPDTGQADTPSGLTVDVKASQEGLTSVSTEGFATEHGAEGVGNKFLAASNIQDTTVTLPEGMVVNPGQAAGLAACQASDARVGDGKDDAPTCPNSSKVGTVQIATPLLEDKLEGNVYVLQSNPPNLKLLVAASADGVNIKLVGNVHLDEATGRLTSTFSGTPQLPFTDFKLSFSGGAQAALATPTGCGVYSTASDFTPWSSPFVGDVFPSSAFAITSGPGGGACVPSPLPFGPSLIAGATTDQAGGFTNFSLLLQNGDGQQRIEKLQFQAPAGLSGMISKVPLCGEPQAAQGSCPSSSQIGHAVVASGPGPYPLVVPQPGQPPAPIYLTGPYKGSPFGLSIVTPVIAGPFDLGTVITRARIDVDPHTAQITVTTDPLPQIIDGVPTDLRTINSVIDRPGFIFNPTNCNASAFSGTAWGTPPPGAGGPGATAPISSHFQVGSCRSLEFKPDFKVSVSGKNSKAGGAALTTKIVNPPTPPGGQGTAQAGFARVKVELPKQLPSRLTTLQKACLAAVFDASPASCPAASVVGHAKVLTPLLPVPLEGPAYFVSHGGEAFPDLTIVLQGDGVTNILVGTTFINNAGVTSTTFKATPDVPFSRFELTLPQGQYSALTANGNLCSLSRVVTVKRRVTVHSHGRTTHVLRKVKRRISTSLAMPTEFIAQNGLQIHQSTPISVTGCPKAKKAKIAGRARRHGKASLHTGRILDLTPDYRAQRRARLSGRLAARAHRP